MPAVHRARDQETSRDAGRLANLTYARRQVWRALRWHGPATDERLEQILESMLPPSSVRGARHWLVMQRLARDTGRRRTTRTGHRAIVWEVVGLMGDE